MRVDDGSLLGEGPLCKQIKVRNTKENYGGQDQNLDIVSVHTINATSQTSQ